MLPVDIPRYPTIMPHCTPNASSSFKFKNGGSAMAINIAVSQNQTATAFVSYPTHPSRGTRIFRR